jgi:uncharacterized protein
MGRGPGDTRRAEARREARVSPAEGLGHLVTAFAEGVPEVAHAAVVSSDGLLVASSRGLSADRGDQLAALTSGLTSLVRGAARHFVGGPVAQTAVLMEHRMLILMPMGGNSVLAVLATAEGDADLVVHEMEFLREQAGRFLE